jgi:hypothetical protein
VVWSIKAGVSSSPPSTAAIASGSTYFGNRSTSTAAQAGAIFDAVIAPTPPAPEQGFFNTSRCLHFGRLG